jgi:pimeloyl-[acyl-carrier protein] methyl ester esterase
MHELIASPPVQLVLRNAALIICHNSRQADLAVLIDRPVADNPVFREYRGRAPANINRVSPRRAQIVLLPGMDGTGDLFADFIEALPPDIKATVIRYPEAGPQTYTELCRFLETSVATSGPYVLVAESFSVPLAIQWAASGKAGLKGLVLCAGFSTSPVVGWRRSLCLLLSPMCFLVRPPEFAIRAFLVGRAASNSLVREVRMAIGSVNPRVLGDRLRTVLSSDSRSALREVRAPVVFVQPTEDKLVGIACLNEMRDIRPDSDIELVPGPHLLLQAKPQESAEVIGRYVRQLVS